MGSKTDSFAARMGSEQGSGPAGSEFVGGVCPALLTLESVIAEIAPTNIPVLLVGESGTGKEMFARHIHALSPHSAEPLVKLSCASVNEETLSSELGLHGNRHHNGAQAAAGTVLLGRDQRTGSGLPANPAVWAAGWGHAAASREC